MSEYVPCESCVFFDEGREACVRKAPSSRVTEGTRFESDAEAYFPKVLPGEHGCGEGRLPTPLELQVWLTGGRQPGV